MVLGIVQYPEEILKERCKEVIYEEIYSWKKTIKDMFETMEYYGGVGLAAPQVGIPKRFFVMRNNIVMFNPEIIALEGKIKSYDEGCLSCRNYTVTIKRAKKIIVQAYDINGDIFIFKTKTKLDSIILQHEVDHLNGITLFDRAKKMR
jgi:peptide deformylase